MSDWQIEFACNANAMDAIENSMDLTRAPRASTRASNASARFSNFSNMKFHMRPFSNSLGCLLKRRSNSGGTLEIPWSVITLSNVYCILSFL